MWWLPGIFRDVTLLARPVIEDVFVHADYDHVTGSGTLRVDVDPTYARVLVPELGLELTPGETVQIPRVEPWSAEVPRLYDAQVVAGGETVEVRIGFRTVAMIDGLLTINGQPLFFRGVNRHEHDPRRGRAISLETMRQDLVLMKQHNINAVRTAHYPPHPAFLDLCDELGLWVIDECDIETHGFIYTDWRGNPADDPDWAPMMLDRMRRMVERDKNHPSVIIWSLANESHRGRNFGVLAEWTRERDPARALFYERDRSYEFSDFYSLMYTPLDELERIGTRTEDVTVDDPELEARRRALPFILAEYAHAMGNGPGGLADYQRILERYPRLQGGFVWEWIDHGLLLPGATDYVYGGHFGERVHGANFCIDGLLFPDRTPSPGLLEYKKVIEPVRITLADNLIVHNLQTFGTLDHLEFLWVEEIDGVEVRAGRLDVPAAEAGAAVEVGLPVGPPWEQAPPDLTTGVAGERWLTVRAVLAKDESWAAAGHEVAWAQFQLPTESGTTGRRGCRGSGTRGRWGCWGSGTRGTQCGREPAGAGNCARWRSGTSNRGRRKAGWFSVVGSSTRGRGGWFDCSGCRWRGRGSTCGGRRRTTTTARVATTQSPSSGEPRAWIDSSTAWTKSRSASRNWWSADGLRPTGSASACVRRTDGALSGTGCT